MACWITLTLPRSGWKVKVVIESVRLKVEIVAKMVNAAVTLSKCILVSS